MPKIEFLYFADCPNYVRALAILREVMAEEYMQTPIEIIQVETENEARQHTFYGSPTIRINGDDIAPIFVDGMEPCLTCRTYQRTDGHIVPLPPRELIVVALRRT
jgi:hypothetical protein